MMELVLMVAALATAIKDHGRIEDCTAYFKAGQESSDSSVVLFADFLMRVCEVGIKNALLDRIMDGEITIDSRILELISNDNKETNDKQTLVICFSAGKQILQSRYGIWQVKFRELSL